MLMIKPLNLLVLMLVLALSSHALAVDTTDEQNPALSVHRYLDKETQRISMLLEQMQGSDRITTLQKQYLFAEETRKVFAGMETMEHVGQLKSLVENCREAWNEASRLSKLMYETGLEITFNEGEKKEQLIAEFKVLAKEFAATKPQVLEYMKNLDIYLKTQIGKSKNT